VPRADGAIFQGGGRDFKLNRQFPAGETAGIEMQKPVAETSLWPTSRTRGRVLMMTRHVVEIAGEDRPALAADTLALPKRRP
jgi:hypothetical protein